MIKLTSIESLFGYQPQPVLSRYKKDYPDNLLSAEKAWRELLKFFWLCQKHQADKKNNPQDESLDFSCGMLGLISDIDDMWHTFLLFTEEYASFCHEYFGEFIHHAPNVEKTPFERRAPSIEKYLSYIYDHLGEETLRLWCSP
jgi:hypothetical protein